MVIYQKCHTLFIPYSKQDYLETYQISIRYKMRSQYHSLYLLKAIGVLFVLMIHFSCYKIQYFEPLYRCGVPLFYIISGFFLYAKDESVQIQKVKRSIVKIVKLILFSILYIIYFTGLLMESPRLTLLIISYALSYMAILFPDIFGFSQAIYGL